MYWLTSFNRKKHQRRMNRFVRAINKNIANDDLWRGRFVVKQVGTPHFYIYEDKSGAELQNVHLVITDLKTGTQVHGWNSGNGWCHFGGSDLWRFVNDAIVEKFDVWRKEDDLYKCKEDPDYDFNNPKVREKWRKEWKDINEYLCP